MKLNETVWANTAAILTGIIYIVCAAFVAILPNISKVVMLSWFHGINLETLWTGAPRGNFILGLATAVIGTWLVGYIFAKTYNKFSN